MFQRMTCGFFFSLLRRPAVWTRRAGFLFVLSRHHRRPMPTLGSRDTVVRLLQCFQWALWPGTRQMDNSFQTVNIVQPNYIWEKALGLSVVYSTQKVIKNIHFNTKLKMFFFLADALDTGWPQWNHWFHCYNLQTPIPQTNVLLQWKQFLGRWPGFHHLTSDLLTKYKVMTLQKAGH